MTSEQKQLMAAIVAAKEVDPRQGIQRPDRGVAPSAPGDPASGALQTHRFEPDDLLSYPLPLVAAEQHAPVEAALEQDLEFDITRDGKACGVALWFDSGEGSGGSDDRLADATAAETIAGADRQVLYSWPAAVRVTAGDSIRLSLRHEHSGKRCHWRWDSLIRKIDGGRIRGIRHQQFTDSPLVLLDGKRRR